MNTKFPLWLCLMGLMRVDSFPFEGTRITCGYESCHPVDDSKINVHLVPHSHDDLGWLETVDQYYYGNVQYIISSVVQALKSNRKRRFIQVETGFFWKWWQKQPFHVQLDVIDLVNRGQMEMINGAWSMNDEATTNYQSTIDQYTWGLRFLNETFGSCGRPRAGWQIDPFGHSREFALILSQLGFDGLFIGRLDYRDKDSRRNRTALDFIWDGSSNLENTNLFTSIFPDFYTAPTGYCWDITCDDSPINDDPDSPDYNLNKIVQEFAAKITDYSHNYFSNNLLIPMGGDFQFQSAETNFLNIDRLINAFKNHDSINLIYSTPSCYIKAVNEAAGKISQKFSKKTNDFLPHATDPDAFWSGYYTSRPNFKRFERTGNNILQAAKQLAVLSKVNGKDFDQDLVNLREVMGIVQHHDAITGTAKQAVSQDYVRSLTDAIKQTEVHIGTIVGDLLTKNHDNEIDLQLSTCLLANVSICESTRDGRRFMVAVYNPLARFITHYVRLPIGNGTYRVTGPDGEVQNDVFDSISNFDYMAYDDMKPQSNELVFEAEKLPPLGLKLYYVEQISSNKSDYNVEDISNMYYGTNTTGFSLDEQTKRLKSVRLNGQELEITQEFRYYKSANGDNNVTNGDWKRRASGAYIFRPFQNTIDAEPISDDIDSITSQRGQLVDEVKQIINAKFTQIIRVYKNVNHSNYIEFDWLLGDLDVNNVDQIRSEIITRITVTSNFNNSGIFYTDSNGRQMMRRAVNKREDFEYDASDEPIASNYYPVTSKIAIQDDNNGQLRVSVLNDRAQGGSSLRNGEIELMVHRRLLKDDDFGVSEALNEMEFGRGVYVRGQHCLMFGSVTSHDGKSSQAAQERDLSLKKLNAPWVLVADATAENLSLTNLQNLINFNFSGLKQSLPDNVHILTLEPWILNTYLLRLEHILEENDDDLLSQPVTVDLTELFTQFKIIEIRETTLGANQWMDEYQEQKKFLWETFDGDDDENVMKTNNDENTNVRDALKITLKAMQIRTFVIKVDKMEDKNDGSTNQVTFITFILLITVNSLIL